MAKKRLILCGSPHSGGLCDQTVLALRAAFAKRDDGMKTTALRVSDLRMSGCIGCEQCRQTGQCFMRDDMGNVMFEINSCSELYVVCPVFFSGAPSQFKAVLDRLQPHYWKDTRSKPKRPAHLLVMREGGDPWGFDPLTVSCKSALNVAGFALQDVVDGLGLDSKQAAAALLKASER